MHQHWRTVRPSARVRRYKGGNHLLQRVVVDFSRSASHAGHAMRICSRVRFNFEVFEGDGKALAFWGGAHGADHQRFGV